MRVMLATGLYPPDIGGPATHTYLLETMLPKEGIEVTVLSFGRVRRYPVGIRHVVYFWSLLRSSSGCSVMYAQDTLSVGVPALLVAFLRRMTFLVRVPGDHTWEQGTQRYGIEGPLESFPLWSWGWHPTLLVMRFLQLRVVRTAAHVVVPSEYMRRIVLGWGVSEARIVRIYNGVSVGDVGQKETIRGVLHFDGRLIMSVGRLVPWKGFDVLIKVLAKLKKKFPDIRLFIAGSGPDAARLETLVSELHLDESVIFAGTVDHDALLRYIKASDALVLNTSYEGLSHLLIETMAVGVPIVTTRVGGNPEVITDGVNGYLVEPNDMSALQSRITTLFEKPETAARLITSGRDRATHFTDSAMVGAVASLLKTL